MSWPYFPELLATPVPRYTPYPTAAEFHDGIGASDMEVAGYPDRVLPNSKRRCGQPWR